MTVPSNSELNMYDGSRFNQTDWDNNFNQIITWLTSGNYEMTFDTVNATTYTGLPSNAFTLTAGEDLTAGDIVRVSGGQAVKATNANADGITKIVGVAATTTSAAGTVTINYDYYSSFSGLTVGTMYYVGVNGAITSTEPTYNAFEVGTAVSTTRINFNFVIPRTFENQVVMTAGEIIPAGQVVRESGGQVFTATNASQEGVTNILGVAFTSATSAQDITINTLYYPSFSGLTVGDIYYVGASGAVSNSLPGSNQFKLGIAVTASRINFEFLSEYRKPNIEINNSSPTLTLKDTSGGSGERQFIKFESADGLYTQIDSITSGAAVGEMNFSTDNGSGLTERLTLNNDCIVRTQRLAYSSGGILTYSDINMSKGQYIEPVTGGNCMGTLSIRGYAATVSDFIAYYNFAIDNNPSVGQNDTDLVRLGAQLYYTALVVEFNSTTLRIGVVDDGNNWSTRTFSITINYTGSINYVASPTVQG